MYVNFDIVLRYAQLLRFSLHYCCIRLLFRVCFVFMTQNACVLALALFLPPTDPTNDDDDDDEQHPQSLCSCYAPEAADVAFIGWNNI